MLDTTLESTATTDEAVPAAEAKERSEAELAEEETAEEVIVEISVDGMCGVY